MTVLSSNYSELVYQKGSEYFEKILLDIAEAKKSIVVEMYTFKTDPLGKQIIDALTQAVKRGVLVRVLVDGVGTPFWGGKSI